MGNVTLNIKMFKGSIAFIIFFVYFASEIQSKVFLVKTKTTEKSGDDYSDYGICGCNFSQMGFSPVCGMNGKTYSNKCELVCARILKEHDGPCKENPVENCSYCDKSNNPVCGADSKTYANNCVMKCRKVELKHKGACRVVSNLPSRNLPQNRIETVEKERECKSKIFCNVRKF